MRLAEWRAAQKMTQAELALKLGVTQPFISTIERAVRNAVPGPTLMREIVKLTEGAVMPNDFYALPERGQANAA